MKRQILSALAIGSMVVGSAVMLPKPAHASATCANTNDPFSGFTYTRSDFKPWEHPFACDEDLQKISQGAADAYCQARFGGYAIYLASDHYFLRWSVPKTSHIWAHRKDHLCVYND